MLAQLRQLTEKICLERPGSDLSFWRSAYLDLQGVKSDHLSACYGALIETLLGMEDKPLVPCQTKAGMPLLSETAHPMCMAYKAREIAHLWQWIGSLQRNQRLQIAGSKAQRFLDGLKPGLFTTDRGEKYVPNKPFDLVELPSEDMPGLHDPELGLCVHHDQGLEFAFTAVGHDSGFGTVWRDDVGIVSFGPSFWPKPSFGITLSPTDLNPLCEHKPLPGFHVLQQGPAVHYAAWSRIVHEEQHLWCELSAFCRQDLHLAVRFLEHRGLPLSLMMAVKAGALKIGNQLELASRSLKQYKGEAKTVALEGKSSQMVIIPAKQGKMEVVPLAGDSRYWGADFLLIYPFEAHAPHLEWSIY